MTALSVKNAKRVFVLVIDAFGVGGLPDAPDYGDSVEFNTFAGIDREADSLKLPTLERLGLGNIVPVKNLRHQEPPLASYGKMNEYSRGKDTTTGHWEMAGVYLDVPFPTYPEGFPADVMDEFMSRCKIEGFLGNKPASGTEILKELGEEHLKTGFPIVYTSADSVFQIASHIGPESKVTLDDLYRWCDVARDLLAGEHQVSRVIARPFVGDSPETFKRDSHKRKDYALTPPEPTTLTRVKEQGGVVMGVGKIEDIFNFQDVTHSNHTGNNDDGLAFVKDLLKGNTDWDQYKLEDKAIADYKHADKQFVFVNLVDTDSIYGHRRDVNGYARALENIDVALGEMLEDFTENDLLMISADHGCDPTAPGSDHTREYVPIIMYSKALEGRNLGIRDSFADIGRTTLAWLDMDAQGQRGQNMLNAEPALV